MPLRRRILVVTVALFVVGLGVADLATYRFLSSFLVDRIDEQLRAAAGPAEARLARPLHEGEHGLSLPNGSYIALVDEDGRVRRELRFDSGRPAPRPKIPAALLGPRSPAKRPTLTTVGAASGQSEYRMIVEPLGTQGAVVVAMPLADVKATHHRLLLIEGLVSGLVLAAIGIAAYWLTRRELRPLELMAATSRAIAAGDLAQRVEPDDPRTEVGQLGNALNTMLTEIERAFAERVAAEERLRQFVADASHELRTPVTSIRGFAELFRRGAGERPADLANAMRRIEEEGERMGDLVDELLLLARLDQGLPLDREPVDLAGLVEAAVDAARAADPARPIDVECEDAAVVLGAELRLRQVIDNLLTNARAHTPAGTPVHVRLATEGEAAVFEVADEGPGVPDHEADKIFERFHRIDRSRTRSHGGAGLGLAIVRSLVEAHGGTVAYRSRPGGGSVFRVAFPLAQGPPPAAARAEIASNEPLLHD